MELKAFQEKKKMKKILITGIVLFILLITITVIIHSYAIYQEQKDYDVIEGSVPEFMDNFDVKVALTIDGSPATTFPEKNSGKTVDSIVCNKGANATWDYEKWKISVTNLTETKTKCQVSFVTKYTDSVLNGNDPVLAENLIPVTIENQNGENVVKKASQKDAWYDYTKKQWANAVILIDENETYTVGQVIPEEKIESYFVWIPKFDYQIFNVTDYPSLTSVTNQVKTIQVRFQGESTTDTSSECKSPNKSGDIGTCSVGKWMTHPAFVDGFEGKKGMWVGKFETSHNSSNVTNEINPDAIQIKPNVTSWRVVQVANAFYSTYNYKRELDSHMMKNTEWGAAAYLSQSEYGTNQKIKMNNHNGYLTGYVAVREPTCGYTGDSQDCNIYGTTNDVTRPWTDITTLGLASTTGNVSGIYDMSGGAWEYVMGVMMTPDGRLLSGRDKNCSNFIGAFSNVSDDPSTPNINEAELTMADGGVSFPETKYIDAYLYSTEGQNFQRRILGDATGELGPFEKVTNVPYNFMMSSWYQSIADFVGVWNSWFDRGGGRDYGSASSIFAFGTYPGSMVSIMSFRVVLSP